MSGFLRPEAKAALWRWREALVGLGAMVLGLYWSLGTRGLLHWIGYAVFCLSLAIIIAGLQRGRFRQGGGGPGVVEITEGQVSYFGPLSGGTADLGRIEALALDGGQRPPVWILGQKDAPSLIIPLTASGADQLFDVFATLPGIRTERMLATMRDRPAGLTVIWRAEHVSDRIRRLH